MNELAQPFRIAFRAEGAMVNVYLALSESMEGAQLIACCSKAILDVSPDQFAMFRKIMENGIAAAIKDTMGVEVAKFEIQPAPEHERAGHS
jgi:hypothetical protein